MTQIRTQISRYTVLASDRPKIRSVIFVFILFITRKEPWTVREMRIHFHDEIFHILPLELFSKGSENGHLGESFHFLVLWGYDHIILKGTNMQATGADAAVFDYKKWFPNLF